MKRLDVEIGNVELFIAPCKKASQAILTQTSPTEWKLEWVCGCLRHFNPDCIIRQVNCRRLRLKKK